MRTFVIIAAIIVANAVYDVGGRPGWPPGAASVSAVFLLAAVACDLLDARKK